MNPLELLCAVTLIGNGVLFAGADRLDQVRMLALITALGLAFTLAFTLVSTTRALRSTTT